jgi:hypothetical protein
MRRMLEDVSRYVAGRHVLVSLQSDTVHIPPFPKLIQLMHEGDKEPIKEQPNRRVQNFWKSGDRRFITHEKQHLSRYAPAYHEL